MSNEHMQVVEVSQAGGPEFLVFGTQPIPTPGPGEVLIRTAGIGFNRADIVQREGKYPPPEGASEILGLECSGTIVSTGPDTSRYAAGDEVCALLAGGGYAEYVVAPEVQVLPVPQGVELVEAAALVEVAATMLSNLAYPLLPRAGSALLIHGGSGGLGSFGIQLGVALGYRVFATAGTAAGVQHCLHAGATAACNYREEDFVEFVNEHTEGIGVDFVLDMIGAPYLSRNIEALAVDGRLAIVATLEGSTAEIKLHKLMSKRLTIQGSTLRARPITGIGSKAEIVSAVEETIWPLIEDGRLVPLPAHRLPFAEVRKLHEDHAARLLPPGKTIMVTAGVQTKAPASPFQMIHNNSNSSDGFGVCTVDGVCK